MEIIFKGIKRDFELIVVNDSLVFYPLHIQVDLTEQCKPRSDLYTDVFIHLVLYNTLVMIHCTFEGVTG